MSDFLANLAIDDQVAVLGYQTVGAFSRKTVPVIGTVAHRTAGGQLDIQLPGRPSTMRFKNGKLVGSNYRGPTLAPVNDEVQAQIARHQLRLRAETALRRVQHDLRADRDLAPLDDDALTTLAEQLEAVLDTVADTMPTITRLA